MSSKTTYHWQDVKRIIGYHTQKYPKPSKAKVDELKLALKNDGYAVKE